MTAPRVITRRSLIGLVPGPTVAAFLLLAVVLWINAAVNAYRFNVALAVLGSVPVLVLAARAVVLTHGRRPQAVVRSDDIAQDERRADVADDRNVDDPE